MTTTRTTAVSATTRGAVTGAILLGLALAAAPATAQDDILGAWSTADHALPGSRSGSEHDLGEGAAFLGGVEEAWTFTVSEVAGGAFRGEWCSPNMCEQMNGVMHGGNVYAVDEDGIFIGSMSDGMLELCYLEPGEVRVADCHLLARQ